MPRSLKILSAVLTAALLSGGCSWFLPPGDPPEGNIVEPAAAGADTPKSMEAAVNYMTAEFLNSAMGVIPAQAGIYCNTPLAGEVLSRCRGFAAYRPTALPDAEYLLLSSMTAEAKTAEGAEATEWVLRLCRAGDGTEIFRLKCLCGM